MKTPGIEAKTEYWSHESNSPSVVVIPGTKKKLMMREIHPGTMKWLTKLWIEREIASANISKGSEVLKDMCKEPYFAFKEAAILYLNNDLKLRFLYPLLWRRWARKYTESQMLPIITEGKKKLPLWAHYRIMAYSTDMRTDMMKMTKKEAKQYQAELLSDVKQHSSKTSRHTESRDGVSSDGSPISDTTGF